MARSHDEAFPPERRHRVAAWASSIAAMGLLLFTWPFLRSPPLGIGASYAHLLWAWVAVVALLALLSRALARPPPPGGDGA